MDGAQDAAELVLSAEVVSAGTRRVPRERVVVRRRVVTEEVAVTVTVRREVLEVERLPVDPDVDVDPDLGAVPALRTPLVVVLSQERPLVTTEVVPYERVALQVHEVATTTPVAVTARREVLDPGAPVSRDRPTA